MPAKQPAKHDRKKKSRSPSVNPWHCTSVAPPERKGSAAYAAQSWRLIGSACGNYGAVCLLLLWFCCVWGGCWVWSWECACLCVLGRGAQGAWLCASCRRACSADRLRLIGLVRPAAAPVCVWCVVCVCVCVCCVLCLCCLLFVCVFVLSVCSLLEKKNWPSV